MELRWTESGFRIARSLEAEIDRCRREIAAIELELRAGNPDVAGLCLALFDWSMELRILQNEERRRVLTAAAYGAPVDARANS